MNESVFAYVTHRRSFRTGGVNAPVFDSPGTAALAPYQTYQPETLKDYEAGIKTDFEVNSWRVRFNINAFRSEYSGVQTATNVATIVPAGDPKTPFGSGSVVLNMGKRRFTGGEAEMMIRPTSALTFSGNAAYVKQKIISFALPADLAAAFANAGANFAVPVAPQLSPKWAFTLSGRWELPVQPLDGKLVFNADFYRQTSFGVGNKIFPAYDTTNARLEWNDIGESGASVAVFARNVFNQANAVAAGATSIGLGFLSVQYAEPRMYGVEGTFRF